MASDQANRLAAAPLLRGGHWLWATAATGVEVRFTGRGPAASRAEVLATVAGVAMPVRWAKQVHGAEILRTGARPEPADQGPCGVGDGLVTVETGVALAIATADCVPVLLASPGAVAAAHAGWRGVVAGVVPKAVAALRGVSGATAEITAWVGPSIGACCYEVGDEVAQAVAAASTAQVVAARPGRRPHLDVAAAVRWQLETAGVHTFPAAAVCTRCATNWLWSYRRDGAAAGRNLALIWRA
jgi:polyphenol oxidase